MRLNWLEEIDRIITFHAKNGLAAAPRKISCQLNSPVYFAARGKANSLSKQYCEL